MSYNILHCYVALAYVCTKWNLNGVFSNKINVSLSMVLI